MTAVRKYALRSIPQSFALSTYARMRGGEVAETKDAPRVCSTYRTHDERGERASIGRTRGARLPVK
jgi:hypothetical protein